jgi:hypothetical protein
MNIINFEQTCYACPSQWEGETETGQRLYIRYRWGYLRITLDEIEIFGQQLGDEWHGVLEQEKVLYLLNHLGYTINDTVSS